MLRTTLIATVCFATAAALTVHAAPKDDVQAAAKKVADAKSYAWTSDLRGGFGGGTAQGKAEKNGFTVLSMTFFNNEVQAVKKGDKGAVKLQDGWKSFDDAAQDGQAGQPNPGRFLAAYMRNYKTPAVLAQELLEKSKDLKPSGEALEAELTEQGAKDLLTFRGRGGQPREVKNAKGTARFWVKDGTLTKFEYEVSGTININGEDRDTDRTTTVEIKDVGTAKVEVPEEAKKKAS